MEAVIDAREPQNAEEVRSFLGLVNFSARFIPNLASIAEPLHGLTRKQTPFMWGTEQQGAFDALKDSLANAETLAYFDSNAEETKLITDASPVGLVAVLSRSLSRSQMLSVGSLRERKRHSDLSGAARDFACTSMERNSPC